MGYVRKSVETLPYAFQKGRSGQGFSKHAAGIYAAGMGEARRRAEQGSIRRALRCRHGRSEAGPPGDGPQARQGQAREALRDPRHALYGSTPTTRSAFQRDRHTGDTAAWIGRERALGSRGNAGVASGLEPVGARGRSGEASEHENAAENPPRPRFVRLSRPGSGPPRGTCRSIFRGAWASRSCPWGCGARRRR